MMEFAADFSFQPLPALENEVQFPFPEVASSLGPLAGLAGKWTGRGFNVIWRPTDHLTSGNKPKINLSRKLRLGAC